MTIAVIAITVIIVIIVVGHRRPQDRRNEAEKVFRNGMLSKAEKEADERQHEIRRVKSKKQPWTDVERKSPQAVCLFSLQDHSRHQNEPAYLVQKG